MKKQQNTPLAIVALSLLRNQLKDVLAASPHIDKNKQAKEQQEQGWATLRHPS